MRPISSVRVRMSLARNKTDEWDSVNTIQVPDEERSYKPVEPDDTLCILGDGPTPNKTALSLSEEAFTAVVPYLAQTLLPGVLLITSSRRSTKYSTTSS